MEQAYQNKVVIQMESRSVNEAFARMAVSAFAAPLDPTMGEMTDIKTAVSEAVTNAILHGYPQKPGEIRLTISAKDNELTITVADEGEGIVDIAAARTPLYTTKPAQERSGMGFTVMESFMDTVTVHSAQGQGTTVIMTKRIGR